MHPKSDKSLSALLVPIDGTESDLVDFRAWPLPPIVAAQAGASCASGGVETNNARTRGKSHRGPQRACETKFVTVGVNQVEETLSPFGVTGRCSWLAPRRECTFVKSINIGDVKDHAPPPGPAPLDDGRFERINHALVMADRERVGRDASPTAAIIDSQSVKTTEAGGPRGYDAGKKINGRKRHALVDTDGRGLVLEPHPASIQDRDGGGPLMRVSRRIFPFIQRVFADSGYAGEKVAKATLIAVEIVRKNPDQVGFAVNPRRWVVERFFAWIGRNRRLAKDFEATIDSARAFLYAASVMLLVRRIARTS